MGSNAPLERIQRQLGDENIAKKLAGLTPSDRSSLLLEVFALAAAEMTPQDLLRNHIRSVYASPSATDPLVQLEAERTLYEAAMRAGAQPVLLSPAATFGSCSAIAPVSQNKVFSSVRGYEVLSDPSNMLALVAAQRIAQGDADSAAGFSLCSAHRVVRYLPGFRKGLLPHFATFVMVTAGQAGGSYAFELAALRRHALFLLEVLQGRGEGKPLFLLRRRGGYPDGDGLFKAVWDLLAHIEQLDLDEAEANYENAYYRGINCKIMLRRAGELVEVADLGFVDWTAKLLARKRERMLISGIGMERWMSFDPQSGL